MNFHFVDQILELDPGKRAIGLKHVTLNDHYLTPTIHGKPALLSCIVGEALGQLCSWNIIKTTDYQVRSVGGIVSEVNMSGQAFVGDSVLLDITIDHLDDQAVNWHGEASIRGETILVVQSSVGPCLSMQGFNDLDEVKAHFAIINRPGSIPEFPAVGRQNKIGESAIHYHTELVQYDSILDWQPGKEVLAQKNIAIIAPYFADHFPKKPVLPISLLLETKLQLAYAFIEECVGKENVHHYIPRRVYNIKMNDFVQPGDILITRMVLKEQSDDRYVFSYRSEVNQRRICVAETEFTRR